MVDENSSLNTDTDIIGEHEIRTLVDKINWSVYITIDDEEATEHCIEWIQSNIRISRNVLTLSSSIVDDYCTTLEELEDMELSTYDELYTDEDEYTNEFYYCEHCDNRFNTTSEIAEHVQEVEEQSIEELLVRKMTPKNFLDLLINEVWKDTSREELLIFFEKFVKSRETTALEFINDMKLRGLVPTEIMHKFERQDFNE